MKMITCLALSSAVLLAACTSTEERSTGVAVRAPVPKDVGTAIVRALPMQPGALKNVKGMQDAPQFFAGEVRSDLKQKHPGWKIALEGEKGAPSRPDITVDTELLQVEGGSAALRFWIGFGAGAISSRVKVSIRDRNGAELAGSEISQETSCPLGACAEDNEPLVRENLKALARSVSAFVTNPAEYQKKMQEAQ